MNAVQSIAAETWRSGNEDFARDLYGRALQARGPTFTAELHALLGRVAYDAEDQAASATEFRAAIGLAPSEASYHRELARALRGSGDWDAAAAELDSALALDGDQDSHAVELALIHNDRANQAYERARYEDALPDYAEAVRLRPDDDVLHSNLALALEAVTLPACRVENLTRAAAEPRPHTP